jgi:hypothetical protein
MNNANEGARAIVRAATEADPKRINYTFVADKPHAGWQSDHGNSRSNITGKSHAICDKTPLHGLL